MFVDASAIVAILSGEPEADRLAAILEDERDPITSPIAVFESVVGLCRKRHASIAEGEKDVAEFLRIARVRTVPVSSTDAEFALDAFSRYGKGRGHPAQLNMGDCFAYAVAKTHRVSLLFKGEDFAKTDVSQASARGR